MIDHELKLKIVNLKTLILLEEENYKKALDSPMEFSTLKKLRDNIEKLRFDLMVLMDKQSVQQTGELPKENDDKKSDDKS